LLYSTIDDNGQSTPAEQDQRLGKFGNTGEKAAAIA